jgi:hypothetical protein
MEGDGRRREEEGGGRKEKPNNGGRLVYGKKDHGPIILGD